jgi:hypothetical protein
MTVQTATIAYTDEHDDVLVYAHHVSAETGGSKYPPEVQWVLHMGHDAWQRDWLSVWPAELRRDGWPLKAQTEGEAREAVGRAGMAVADWRKGVEATGRLLLSRVDAAREYGHNPELPLS